MMRLNKWEPYVSLSLPLGLMDCRVKPGNDSGEVVRRGAAASFALDQGWALRRVPA